jgi:hypothetical protein
LQLGLAVEATWEETMPEAVEEAAVRFLAVVVVEVPAGRMGYNLKAYLHRDKLLSLPVAMEQMVEEAVAAES